MHTEPSGLPDRRDLEREDRVPPHPQASVGELVERLFETTRKENGEPYTNQEVSDWIRTHVSNSDISPSYIGRIRRGEAPNPSREILRNLCLFFGIPASYFFPELDIIAPRDVPVDDPDRAVAIALRSLGVDPALTPHVYKILRALASPTDRDGSS